MAACGVDDATARAALGDPTLAALARAVVDLHETAPAFRAAMARYAAILRA